MSKFFQKVILKLYRIFGINKMVRIKGGPLKGIKWNSSIPDSRYILGIYEPKLAEIVEAEMKSGKRFIDIGANAGYFSLLANKLGKTDQKHVAVEPFPENIELMNNHFKSNNVSNVEVMPLAVADKNGEIQFSDSGNLAANTYKTESSTFKEKSITVKAVDLNSLSDQLKLDADCFLKIDVEGAELDVLMGGKEYLSKHHPTFLLATHDCHVPGVKAKCIEVLNELGYTYEVVEDEKIEGQEDLICRFTKSEEEE